MGPLFLLLLLLLLLPFLVLLRGKPGHICMGHVGLGVKESKRGKKKKKEKKIDRKRHRGEKEPVIWFPFSHPRTTDRFDHAQVNRERKRGKGKEDIERDTRHMMAFPFSFLPSHNHVLSSFPIEPHRTKPPAPSLQQKEGARIFPFLSPLSFFLSLSLFFSPTTHKQFLFSHTPVQKNSFFSLGPWCFSMVSWVG